MDLPPLTELPTHRVENQPEPRGARDLWGTDLPLRLGVAAQGGRAETLARAGRHFGSAEILSAAAEARRDKPRLVTFDRSGARLDEVRFNAGYHGLMAAGQSAGYVTAAWDGAPGGHVTHAAMVYMLTQVEPGLCCPLTLSYAAVPALAQTGMEAWHRALLTGAYDPTLAPLARKAGATMGMAMTEKQGGSDLRANTSRAERDGAQYRLTGHKWFCSAPMSDGFLTLAQAEGGLSCFLVPRWLEGGRNAIRLMRLKDKLGNQANASAEIEFEGAVAFALGEEGQGIKTILEMVHHTRLDTAMAPAGLMRAALAEAYWWVSGRRSFQRRLIDQPLMRAVLADLVLDWEAALAVGLRVAAAFDQPDEAPLARIAVALAKFQANKRCPQVVVEAMEILGGIGYVEDTPMPMLYREAPLNGIWEGSGNVICLDVLRSLARAEGAAEALWAEIAQARGADRRFDAALTEHMARWPALPPEAEARWFCERLAVLLSASVLLRTAPAAVADAYVANRVLGPRGLAPGAGPMPDATALLARLDPETE